MKKIVGNSQYQKIANALLIIQLLRKGPNTRVAIAQELGLQPSTVTYSINRLIETGLVRESTEPIAQSVGLGRKAVSVEINTDYGRIIGLELLADSGWASIIDPTGRVLYSQPIEYPHIEETDPRSRFESLVTQVIAKTEGFCQDLPILGVGIALPGIVESNNSSVQDCWTHALKQCNFAPFIARSFPYPVMLENDANCCAQRYLYTDRMRQDTFMYLLSRQYPSTHLPKGVSPFGIGIGLVFNSLLYRGSSSRSGEFISTFVPVHETGHQLSITLDTIETLQEDQAIRQKVLQELVSNIRSIDAILDMRAIYLGGFIADYHDEVSRMFPPDLLTKIIFANGHTDASEGAAINVLSTLFRIPQVGDTTGANGIWDMLA